MVGYLDSGTPRPSPKATVEANAVNATLTVANMSKIQTNTGAGAGITLTLPAASDAAGCAFKVQVTVADGDRESRTVPMVFYSGAKVLQFSWEKGVHELTLSMDPAHVRLGQLQSGRAPFTLGHASPNDPEATIGVISNARIETGHAKADVRFSRRPEVDAILADVLDGIMANVSVRARLHRIKETTQEGDTMRSFVSTDWEPFAVALVGVGADPGAHFAAIDGETTDCEIEFHERQIHEYDQQQ